MRRYITANNYFNTFIHSDIKFAEIQASIHCTKPTWEEKSITHFSKNYEKNNKEKTLRKENGFENVRFFEYLQDKGLFTDFTPHDTVKWILIVARTRVKGVHSQVIYRDLEKVAGLFYP